MPEGPGGQDGRYRFAATSQIVMSTKLEAHKFRKMLSIRAILIVSSPSDKYRVVTFDLQEWQIERKSLKTKKSVTQIEPGNAASVAEQSTPYATTNDFDLIIFF